MTKIEWADKTWNPVIGCSKVSPGCKNCYAERIARRQTYMRDGPYDDVINSEGKWNGDTVLVPSALDKPLRWRTPRTIFVCSMAEKLLTVTMPRLLGAGQEE